MLWLPAWPGRAGMAFLGGTVIMTAGLTLVGSIGLRYGAATIVPLLLIWVVAAGLALRRWPPKLAWPTLPRGWSWPAWVLLAVAGLDVATVTAYTLRVPISDWDVVRVWLPKAELIASGGFRALAASVYPDYPPLWPLHIFLANGGNAGVKLLPIAYLIATLLVVFDFVRTRVGPAMAAAAVLAISGVPYIWLPYGVNDLMSEIPMMAFITASTIMLAEYVEAPSPALAVLTAITAVGTVWVRPEGFFHAFLIAAILAGAGLRLHRLRQTIPAALAIVLAYLAW